MSFIQFEPPLADAANYPVPVVHATPRKLSIAFNCRAFEHSSQFRQDSYFTKNGRSALGYIIEQFNLSPDSTVLLPEYHCPAMVEPFLWAGVKVQFYPLLPDLSVDLVAFEQLLTEKVDAVLLVRFFGFSTNIEQVLTRVKQQQIKVIEDCAHAFFSEQLAVNSVHSDASFCSLNKFFSCFDGGMLRTTDEKIAQKLKQLKGPGVFQEVKHALGKIDALTYLSLLKRKLTGTPKVTSAPAVVNAKKSDFIYFSEQDLTENCYGLTKAQIAIEHLNRIAHRRRENFQFLAEHLQNSSVGKPLFSLEGKVVPYVFPFLLNQAEDFEHIRQQGIQILRWEEFCTTGNEQIEHYRQRLIQIPCHQDLSEEQLAFIVKVINKNSYD